VSIKGVSTRGYHVRPCDRCGSEYWPTSGKQRLCADCQDSHLQITAKWRVVHAEWIKEYNRKSYAEHRERNIARTTKWIKENPEARKINAKKAHVKNKSKRRALGFVPLNKPFDGADAHHVSKEYVVYIPRDLHKSVSHNIWTGKNMEQINLLALGYLVQRLECAA